MEGRLETIARIFAGGRRLGADAREAFLRGACGADAGMRAEVEALLRAHDRAPDAERDPLAGAATPALAAELLGRATPNAESIAADAGTEDLAPRVAGFRVLRRLAEGGMGTVYLAEQDRPRRPVALKVLRPEAASPEGRRRFQREAEVLAQLEHPGIARVFVFGTTEPPGEPRPYLAMEYVEGEPLTAAVRRLALRDRIALLAEVAEAVAHAHARGIVHRDLKPENVLVTANGRPKVVDFGVARLVASEAAQRTRAGLVIGTLAYMSPEQARGDVDAVDTRSDVYALGVVAYEALCGRHPLGDAGGTFPEVAARIATEIPTDPGEVDRRLKGDVAVILRKALEKEPEHRYVGAAALADDLRRHLRDEPILARPLTGTYVVGRLVRRHKKAVAAAALGLVALVAGLVLALDLARAEQRERLRADRGAEVLRRSLAQRGVDVAAGALREGEAATAREALARVPEDLRGWEWRHLAAAAEQGLEVEPIPIDAMRDGRLGPEGEWIVRAASGEIRARLAGDASARTLVLPDGVRRPMFALLGGTLRIVGSRGKEVVLAEPTGRVLWSSAVSGPGPLEVAAGSEDGRFLAIGFGGNRGACPLYLLDARTGEPLWRGSAGPVETGAIAISTEAHLVACGGWDARVRLLDLETGKPSGADLVGQTGVTLSLAFSPDGARVAGGSRDRTAHVWDLPTRIERHRLGADVGDVTSVAFSPDGRRLATGGADGTLRVWDADSGAPLRALVGHEGAVRHVRFAPDGETLTSLADDGVRRWDAGDDPSVLRVHRTEAQGNRHPYVYAAAFSPDGRLLATAGWDGTVRLVETATAELLATIETGEDSVRDVRWTPDGRSLVGGHRRLRRWDAVTGETVAAWDGPGTDSVALTPDGTRVITGDEFDVVRVHRTDDLQPSAAWHGHGPEVFDLSVSPDGLRVAAISLRGHVVVRDLETGAVRWRGRPFASAPFGAVAFSPDGRLLAIGGGDRTVRVLDAATGDERHVLRGHADAVYGLAWSPDGRRLFSGSNDATLRVWDPLAGQPCLELRGHRSYVYRVAVSPDGETVATASGDDTVRIWSTAPTPKRTRDARAARQARPAAEAHVAARLAAGTAPRDLAEELRRDVSLDDETRAARLHALIRRLDGERAARRAAGR